ncbi:anti-sigma factor RsbA family regulatory protein [Streptomyces sp. NPDC007904]|uniref:anti-sigma factor RsbA family regulatory protein n=1 Tax=Streptomyces sp. NPDC007904 TaxID=3364787 RepID=UPI0036E6456D
MSNALASPAAGLIHQGLVYGSDEEFLAATVPFCLDGLEGDEAVLSVTTEANIDLLRQGLGDVASQVEFIAADHWYQAPGRTLGAYYRYVDERTAKGRHRQVRVIGEPVWHGRDETERAEWTRYESVINIAFASCPAWIVCPYDIRVLPEAVVADARRTHPQLVTGPAVHASDHYLPPTAPDGAWERELALGSVNGKEAVMRFGADLGQARAFVADAAASLGMSPTGTQRLVFAVNEVATNALQHGGGNGQVVVRRTGHRIVCDITDPGESPADWYAGYLPPDPAQQHGHGLWVVRQLCDLVEVHARPSGTTVRLHLNLA